MRNFGALRIALEDMKNEKAIDDDVAKLKDNLATYNAKVQSNVEIVTPQSLGQSFLLHVSTDVNIRRFVPEFSRRAANSENRMIARIHVSPTLLGCFIGYAKTLWDFMDNASDGKKESGGYRGGFKVYGLPFKAALKPNGRMVYDSTMSDEHWLTSYSAETSEYVPFTAAKAFYSAVTHFSRTGKYPMVIGTLYVDVQHPDGIAFSKNIHLDKGYWKIDGPMPEKTKSFETDKGFKAISISKSDYQAVKNESAALLGFED